MSEILRLPNNLLLHDLYLNSEYLTRHLPLSSHYLKLFMEILNPTMPKHLITNLGEGAKLHDVGKKVALELLEKPDLTYRERELIHTHPTVGGQILGGIYGTYHPFTLMAETHHENYDGSGYPYHLKGEDIPYFGRLMAIADVFSTVTQKRPYEAHVFTPLEGLELLEQEAGRKFDPTMIMVLSERLKYELADGLDIC